MKKIGIILLIISCLMQSFPLCVIGEEVSNTEESTSIVETIDQANSAVASGSFSLDALNPLLGSDKLVDNVRAACIYEVNSQTLMYAWNADTQMYPASLVKLMTALLAIERGQLTDVVTVSQSAVSSVPLDAVSSKLVAGEKLTLEELLYCLLLGSGNDAAAVIAEHISGSQSAFVDEMNRYAQALGCSATQFTNPHGLHDDNQHTTARDCARILDAALKNELFKVIFTADEFTVQATNMSPERVLTYNNSMKDSASKLYYDPRVIGGRTGTTKDGRRCFAAVAQSNGMLVISIVMGSESVYQDDGYTAVRIGGYKETTKLFDACLNGNKTSQLLRAGQVIRQIPIEGASNDLFVGPMDSVITILPQELSFSDLVLRYSDKNISLPIFKGDYVSDVQIWNGSMCVAQVPLYAMNDLAPVNINQMVDEMQSLNSLPTALWIVFGIALGTVLAYLIFRFSGKIKEVMIRMRRKRYRRSHKRVR